MACSGAHCSYHSTGTSTCSGHRTSCATNRRLAGGNPPGRGSEIRSYHIEDLRNKVRAEVSRWNQHRWYGVPLYESNSHPVGSYITDNDMFYNIDRMIHGIRGGAPNVPTSVTQRGDELIYNYYLTLVNEYNQARQNCICNTDCACNAVCACHNDCGCNYSDERLKKEIQYC